MSKTRLEKIMKEKGIGYLHITAFDNLKSILETGELMSLKRIQESEIKPSYASSEDSRSIDRYKEIDKYVRLCLYQQNDFIVQSLRHGNLKNPAIIMIKREIINISDEVRITNMNAITNGALLYNLEQVDGNLDYEKIWQPRSRGNWSDQIYKDARQSEVLIPNSISKDFFVRIYVEKGINISHLQKYGVEFEEMDIKERITKLIWEGDLNGEETSLLYRKK